MQESGCLAVGTSKNPLFVIECSAFIPALSPLTADTSAAQQVVSKQLPKILYSGHSGEIADQDMVQWHGLQCDVTGSTDGTV
jgi:hypothetical protein